MIDNKVKNEIIKEYELKRKKALKTAQNKKEKVMDEIPAIRKLRDEQDVLSIETLKLSICSDKLKKEIGMENIKSKMNNIGLKINKLLKDNGYELEYFKPVFECSKCSDTGYIKNNMCSCLKQELLNRTFKQYNMNKLKDENFETFDYKYYSTEVKEEYKSKISPKDNIKKIHNISLEFCKNIEEEKQLNLLFVGNTGLGKTFLSNSIAYELIKNGYTAVYQTSSALMDIIIKYRFTLNKTKEDDENYNRILESDLLIIDDLGTETVNNMKFTELFNIINTRILNNKKMVISTNLGLEKLYELYDERIVSRLIGDFKICRFYGEDIRLKKKMNKVEKNNNNQETN